MTDLELAIVRFDGNGNEPYADLIVDALRKQIPMEPRISVYHNKLCPSCSATMNGLQHEEFCGFCGQALKAIKV